MCPVAAAVRLGRVLRTPGPDEGVGRQARCRARGELFAQCASCHGPDGGGKTDGSMPRIAGQHYRVLAKQIVDFRHGKRWDFRMEGVATSHESFPSCRTSPTSPGT